VTNPPARTEPVVSVAQRILAARNEEVAHFAHLYPLLLAEVQEILAGWNRSVDELPWSQLEASERQNDLGSVITRVIDCAMSASGRRERVSALVDAACNHGQSRRKQGVLDVDSIFSEYDKLRSCVWKSLKNLVPAPTSFDAIFVIDGLMSIATRGTVLGYHRKEMEANGVWEKYRAELRDSVRS
jgi:hypothetical protein